jgi:hypothetical protein
MFYGQLVRTSGGRGAGLVFSGRHLLSPSTSVKARFDMSSTLARLLGGYIVLRSTIIRINCMIDTNCYWHTSWAPLTRIFWRRSPMNLRNSEKLNPVFSCIRISKVPLTGCVSCRILLMIKEEISSTLASAASFSRARCLIRVLSKLFGSYWD